MHPGNEGASSGAGAVGAGGGAAAGTASLPAALSAFTKFILHSTGRDFYAAVGELDLSLTQIRALHVLCRETEEASLNQLADAIGLSLPAASRSIDGLVQRGLVSRSENANDRRAKTLRATDDAHALIDDLAEMRLAGIADFVATLNPEEREHLHQALEPIVAREEIARLLPPGVPQDRNRGGHPHA